MTLSAEKPPDLHPGSGDVPEPRGELDLRRPARRRRRPWTGIVTLIVIAWLLVFVLPAYLTLNPDAARIVLNDGVTLHYPLLILHVATGTIAMLTGCFQISHRLRAKYPRAHRISGRIYVGAVLVGAPALAALIVLRAQNLGEVSTAIPVGFGFLTVLWVLTTIAGLRAARQHRFADHRRMMIYSYAMTLSIIWSRFAFAVAMSIPGADLRWVEEQTGWMPWVLNLVIAQWWLNRTARRPVRGPAGTPAAGSVEPEPSDSAEPVRPGRKREIALWVIQAIVALVYVSFGLSMLTGAEQAVVIYDRIGWGDWFRYAMGALYLAAAIGLVISRLVRAAAIGLATLIVIGIVSHAAIGDANGLVFLVPLVLVAVVIRGRRARLAV